MREHAENICARLHDAGYQALFNGGCVRDIILGRQPADYDVCTDARPERVTQIFPNSLTVGAKFGVVIVVEDGIQTEVATFRSDIGSADGRHPERVEFSTSPKADVQRRDFTINGLLMDPDSGDILDFVGGQADIKAQIIRAIGEPELRFEEDKLRMLRAVRFAARFDYSIESRTFVAMRKLASQIHQVSQERIRDELTKVLTEGAAQRAFELLDESGLLREVLPEVARMKGVEQPPQFHPEGDVWTHTLLMIGKLQAGAPRTLAWGVLLHDVGKPPTFRPPSNPNDRIRFDEHVPVGVRIAEDISRRLRFSNEDTEQIASLVANHMRFKDVPNMKDSTRKRFARLPHFEQHMELHRLDCLSSHGSLSSYDFVQRFLAETPPEAVRPPRLLNGEDLKSMGFRPGPLFKEILTAVEDAQLEGKIGTRDEAVSLIHSQFTRKSV